MQDFYFDGTRWLSKTLYTWPSFAFPAAISATSATFVLPAPPLEGGSDIWLVDWTSDVFVASGGTALGVSHKWVGTLNARDVNNAATLEATNNVFSGASGIFHRVTTAIGALQDNGTLKYAYAETWTKTGTPGNIQVASVLSYRLVAT